MEDPTPPLDTLEVFGTRSQNLAIYVDSYFLSGPEPFFADHLRLEYVFFFFKGQKESLGTSRVLFCRVPSV